MIAGIARSELSSTWYLLSRVFKLH